jgi:hypothetical protein
MLEISVAVVAIVAIAAIIWTTASRRNRRTARTSRKQWIIDGLRSITDEADRKRMHIHAPRKIDVDEAFVQLRKLTADHSREIVDAIDEMEQLWQELDSQFAEFTQGSSSSTLQTSLLTARTTKLANRLGDVARRIEEHLE